MPLDFDKPFISTRLEEERAKDKGKSSGVWFNNTELIQLEELGRFFHQEKESTVIKHCIEVTKAIIEGRNSATVFRDIVFNNCRKNRRMGIEEIEPKFRIS